MIKKLLLYLYHHRRLLLAITTIATASILLLTLLPSDQFKQTDFLKYDKIGHALVFGGWTFLFGLVRFSYNRMSTYFWGIELAVGISFGLCIELLQHFLPINRSADFYDLLADILGVLIAVFFLKKTHQTLEEEAAIPYD